MTKQAPTTLHDWLWCMQSHADRYSIPNIWTKEVVYSTKFHIFYSVSCINMA